MFRPQLDRRPLPSDWIEPLSDGRWKVEIISSIGIFLVLSVLLSGALFLSIIFNIVVSLFKQNMTVSLDSLYIAGFSLVCLFTCLILLFRTHSYYIIDTVRAVILYHFKILPFERDFQIAKFAKIAGVAVLSDIVKYKKSGTYEWFYHIVVVLKNKKKYRLTTDIALLQGINEAAETLAQILKVKCWQCRDEHSSKIELDAATRNITVTYTPYEYNMSRPNMFIIYGLISGLILSFAIFLIYLFYSKKYGF